MMFVADCKAHIVWRMTPFLRVVVDTDALSLGKLYQYDSAVDAFGELKETR